MRLIFILKESLYIWKISIDGKEKIQISKSHNYETFFPIFLLSFIFLCIFGTYQTIVFSDVNHYGNKPT